MSSYAFRDSCTGSVCTIIAITPLTAFPHCTFMESCTASVRKTTAITPRTAKCPHYTFRESCTGSVCKAIATSTRPYSSDCKMSTPYTLRESCLTAPFTVLHLIATITMEEDLQDSQLLSRSVTMTSGSPHSQSWGRG